MTTIRHIAPRTAAEAYAPAAAPLDAPPLGQQESIETRVLALLSALASLPLGGWDQHFVRLLAGMLDDTGFRTVVVWMLRLSAWPAAAIRTQVPAAPAHTSPRYLPVDSVAPGDWVAEFEPGRPDDDGGEPAAVRTTWIPRWREVAERYGPCLPEGEHPGTPASGRCPVSLCGGRLKFADGSTAHVDVSTRLYVRLAVEPTRAVV